MRILQINSVCGVGSTGRIATDLYKVLEGQGHECVIAYGRGKAHNNVNTFKICSRIQNYFDVAKTRLFDKHGFGCTKATIRLIKWIKEYNPDIIHLHNIHGYYLNIDVLFSYLRESNKPVIWTLHDCWAFTGHCSYFDYIGCERWKDGCYSCLQKKSYPSSILLDNSKWNYQKKKELFTSIENMILITPSEWLKGLVQQSYLNKYEVKVINNGIDLDVFMPTKSNIKKTYDLEDKFIILGVASVWARRKGYKYFIDLSKKLKHDERIVLIGVTEKQKNKLPYNIIGIPRTNSTSELAEIYSVADVFVNPTLEDNFPTTNLEALACGTPVITFNTGGSVESIDNNSGIVVEKANLEQLVAAIQNIRLNKINSNNCIKRSQLYDKNSRYSDYIHQYSILSNKL